VGREKRGGARLNIIDAYKAAKGGTEEGKPITRHCMAEKWTPSSTQNRSIKQVMTDWNNDDALADDWEVVKMKHQLLGIRHHVSTVEHNIVHVEVRILCAYLLPPPGSHVTLEWEE
jgi:hypothetical protein